VSVTLDEANLLWLRSRAGASRRRSLSDTLDRIVTEARLGSDAPPGAIKSVVGTVDVGPDDPGLDAADAYIQELFAESARRPFLVRERPPARRAPRRKARRG
jgi:hypothetical protein